MTSYGTADVAEFQNEMKQYGVNIASNEALKLLCHVGNRYLCVDALLMTVRPEWLEELVGPRAK